MLKSIFNFLKLLSPTEAERHAQEQYLARSTDLLDLERRQRQLVFKENSGRYM